MALERGGGANGTRNGYSDGFSNGGQGGYGDYKYSPVPNMGYL